MCSVSKVEAINGLLHFGVYLRIREVCRILVTCFDHMQPLRSPQRSSVTPTAGT